MLATAGVLALGGALLAPQTASAAPSYSCPGHEVATYRHYWKTGGPTYGYTHLYYSSANGGTNCIAYVPSLDVGTKRYMGLEFRFTAGGRNYGDFAYYAGPVVATNMDGKCVYFHVEDTPPSQPDPADGGSLTVGGDWGPVHCG